MKRLHLEKKLSAYGWFFERHGAKHDVWTNGTMREPVPRHKEIDERLAKKIIRKARNNRGEKG